MKKSVCAMLFMLFIAGCGGASSSSQQPTQTSVGVSPEVSGYIYPKYLIMGIVYAPPGSASSVAYPVGNKVLGTSTINTQAFSSGVSINSQSAIRDAGIANNYTQLIDNSYSNAIGIIPSIWGITIPGPQSSSLGVNHDDDIIFVWLNPAVRLTITGPTSARWDGYDDNPQDKDQSGHIIGDVVSLYVSQLKDPSLIHPNLASRLARTWDTSGVGGLTGDDYAAILAADPFSSGSYNPAADKSYRYDLQMTTVGSTFKYVPPPSGGQPSTQTFAVQPQNPLTPKNLAQYMYSAGCAVDGSADFKTFVNKYIMIPNTYTTTATWNSMASSSTLPAQFSITGPATSDNYTGPTVFQVWRDNIFGSYMFYPAPRRAGNAL